jgi:alpha-ribazole phosphatase
MSEILLIRHAQTDMAGTFCGSSDPELNARGWIQVRELVERLRSENIGTVYTSDLRRAFSTASAIAVAHGVECHVRPLLREIDFGCWEGLAWKEIEQQDPIYAHRWMKEYPHLPSPEGESLDCFEARVLKEIRLLWEEAQNMDQSVAVVSHAGVLRFVLSSFHECTDEEAWEQTRPYCSIVRHTFQRSTTFSKALEGDKL